ncbi:MAG: hypothetical protein QGG53_26890 [Planctomycetota bacterium]|jgi:hypothetical protein|nr:hypothetical protein [Planctomycetota bacterium]
MIESPLIEELMQERDLIRLRKDILQILKARFGGVPTDISARIEAKQELDELETLVDASATTPGLEAFRQKLSG